MQKQQKPLLTNEFQQKQKSKCFQNYQFQIYLSRQRKCNPVYLTFDNQNLTIGSKSCNEKEDIKIKINDFIGFSHQQMGEQWIKIKLNEFVKKHKIFRGQRRYLEHYTVFVNRQQFSTMQKLKLNLLKAATNLNFMQSSQQPRLMIYFNPNAGSNSKKHFDRTIDFISHTNFTFDLVQTTKQHHCLQHINNELKLQKYNGIVIISGDGLMHEFVNSRAAGVVPVTHVPAGSGNAFAKYQTVLAGQACQDEEAIYLAVKNRTRKLNLAEFQLQKISKPIFSFLSFQWCFMADVDMNSQFLRFLGGLRFDVYGLWRVIRMRKYRGKLTYSETQTSLPPLNCQIEDIENFKTQQKVYLHQVMTMIPWVSTRYQISPLLSIQDEAIDMQIIGEQVGRFSFINYLLKFQSGQQFDKEKQIKQKGFNFDWAKIKSFRLQPNGDDHGCFGIDGEKYDAQKIQAKISSKKLLTFA